MSAPAHCYKVDRCYSNGQLGAPTGNLGHWLCEPPEFFDNVLTFATLRFPRGRFHSSGATLAIAWASSMSLM